MREFCFVRLPFLDSFFNILVSATFYAFSSSDKFFLFDSAIFGNLLTLVALPYVRYKYRSQYSMLKYNSVTLLLHLSLCDLLYGITGFPHLIHAHLYMTNIYSCQVCYLLGMFRNLVAYTDFNTIAVLSCCIARQTLCR